MKTVAIISQKGGSGKTTLALHLAVAVTSAGHNVAVIDLDPQASAANWADRREAELPAVVSAHASRLHHVLKTAADNEGDFAFLDTAPHSDRIAVEAARAADFVLIPCRPAILDMEAITNTLDLVRITKAPMAVVLNAVSPIGNETEEAAEAVASLGVAVCPVRLVNRIAFSRSLITGRTAQEIEPDGKAAQEIAHLHEFITSQLHVCTRAQREQPP